MKLLVLHHRLGGSSKRCESQTAVFVALITLASDKFSSFHFCWLQFHSKWRQCKQNFVKLNVLSQNRKSKPKLMQTRMFSLRQRISWEMPATYRLIQWRTDSTLFCANKNIDWWTISRVCRGWLEKCSSIFVKRLALSFFSRSMSSFFSMSTSLHLRDSKEKKKEK